MAKGAHVVVRPIRRNDTPEKMIRRFTKKVKKIYVALDTDAKKDSVKLVKFLMDNGIESYLLSMNEKDPSELGFENFWKRIEKTEQSTFSDIIKGKLYG